MSTRQVRRRRARRGPEDDPTLLYEHAPCGYLSTTPDGFIVRVNATFCTWLGIDADDLLGRKLVELLTAGGRIFHETHYAPMVQMQGSAHDIAFDLVRADRSRLPVLMNASLVRSTDGQPHLVRVAVFDATERRAYERELVRARNEQEAELKARRSRRPAPPRPSARSSMRPPTRCWWRPTWTSSSPTSTVAPRRCWAPRRGGHRAVVLGSPGAEERTPRRGARSPCRLSDPGPGAGPPRRTEGLDGDDTGR